MDFKQKVVDLVSEQVDLPKEKISMLIARPKNPKMGDYAFTEFALAKIEHNHPALFARDVSEKLRYYNLARLQAFVRYVNLEIDHYKLVKST